MRIVLTGGGTGGHFFPALAVARELKNIVQNNLFAIPPGEGASLEILFMGPETVGEELLLQEGIRHKKIMAGKIRRYASLKNILDILKFPFGLIQSLWHLFWFMPNAIFSKGGFGSVPVVLAAWLYGIPILIHESDSVPGLANKFGAKFAKRVAVSFPSAASFFPQKKIALTGNPVRKEILGGTKEDAKSAFVGFTGFKSTLLVLGGSQGAKAINQIILDSLPKLLNRCEIIHQCGKENFEEFKTLFNQKPPEGYFLAPFLDENQLRAAFGATDIVISRAGATSIAEISVLKKPSILIPLPSAAADHQSKNATEYASAGAAVVISQANLVSGLFIDQIFNLLDNPDLMKKMNDAAGAFNPPDAARKISQELLNIAKW